MSVNSKVYLTHCGSSTPIGTRSGMSAAMYQAGISRYAKHPYMLDPRGKTFPYCRAQYLDDRSTVIERMFFLSVRALEELPDLTGIPLILCLPEFRPGITQDLEFQIIKRIQRFFPQLKNQITFVRGDHASGMIALEQACQWIQSGETDCCVVGGVDSYFSHLTIHWLEEQEWIHNEVVSNGFTPGEAASFLMLSNSKQTEKENWTPLAELTGIATAKEKNPYFTEEVCTAKALREVIEAVSSSSPSSLQVYCDLNGDRERANEFGFLLPQLSQLFPEELEVEIPSTSWGDLGAATAPAMISLALASAQRGLPHAEEALFWCSSLGQDRGAAHLKLLNVQERKDHFNIQERKDRCGVRKRRDQWG